MTQDLALRAAEQKLGARVTSSTALRGGDINSAFRLTLSDGRSVFLKTNDHARAPSALFACEAAGLEWLRESNTLTIPRVLAVSPAGEPGPGFLVLEFIASGPKVRDFDERLGRGLAALHRFGAPWFGFHHHNFIGSLEQPNDPRPTWASFYREQRLEPQLRRAVDRGRVDAALSAEFSVLFARLDSLVGALEPPSRLHGDLWGGNLHVDERGLPCLIDPATYGGHREIDLAMMRLFGGFAPRVFDAYAEAWPLSPGHIARVHLYQLYPLLVHVNLFGGSYAASVRRALSETLASA